MHPTLAQADPFWDVKRRETMEEDILRRDIAVLQTELDLAQRVESIRHAPGWTDFVKAVEAMQAAAKERLIADKSLTNEGLREERGRVRAFEQMILLMTKAKISEPLALRLQERKNELAGLRRPQPREAST